MTIARVQISYYNDDNYSPSFKQNLRKNAIQSAEKHGFSELDIRHAPMTIAMLTARYHATVARYGRHPNPENLESYLVACNFFDDDYEPEDDQDEYCPEIDQAIREMAEAKPPILWLTRDIAHLLEAYSYYIVLNPFSPWLPDGVSPHEWRSQIRDISNDLILSIEGIHPLDENIEIDHVLKAREEGDDERIDEDLYRDAMERLSRVWYRLWANH